MKYNPKIHHRRSIRLKGYDYSQAGAYFVTICCQHHECFFGKIVTATDKPVGADLRVSPDSDSGTQMQLNAAGLMVEKWYTELENKFPDIECHEFVVMPNHFHCIVVNNGSGNPNLMDDGKNDLNTGGHGENMLGEHAENILGGHTETTLGEHVGSPLRRVVQWFKTMSTNEYIRGVKTLGWKPFNGKLWQRNYYEHIIRNEQSYQRIANYIINNPANWKGDKFFRE